MPIYTYICESCGEQKEILQKSTDKPPKCTCKSKMKKVLSKCSFQLKGGCWAKDGYKK